MITRKNAIEIGTVIVAGAAQEIRLVKLMQLSVNPDSRIVGARGASYEALKNVWYDLLPNGIKQGFDFEFGNYAIACGWNELHNI